MLLIGDSHTRSYVKSTYLDLIIFLGSGREINFISRISMFIYFIRCITLKFSSPDLFNRPIYITLGEPDIRFVAYDSFNISGKANTINKRTLRCLNKSVQNVFLLIRFLKYCKIEVHCIIGVGTPNEDLNRFSIKFNNLVNLRCRENGIHFFNPQFFYDTSNNKEIYHCKNVFNVLEVDRVHLSQRVSQDLDSFISEIGFENVKLLPYNTKLLQYNNDFGVQVYQDPKIISIIFRVMLKLRGVIFKKYM